MQSNNIEKLNPYKDKISVVSNKIEKIEIEKNRLAQEIIRYSDLDTTDHASKIDVISSKLSAFNEKKNALSTEIMNLNFSNLILATEIGPKYNPLNFISKKKRELKKHQDENLKKISLLEKEIVETEAKVTNSYSKKANLIDDIEFKKEFNLKQEILRLEKIKNDLRNLNQERNILFDKFDRVEAGLNNIKEQLSVKYSELNQSELDLKTAEDLLDRIENADDSRERWSVHQECEEIFGVGKPNQVIGKLKKKIQSLEREINKLLDRAKQIVIKLERNISLLVIDGNNLCHQNSASKGNNFIKLKALIPLVKILKNKYKLQVVFDSSIKKSLDFQNITASLNLEDECVHIVNNKADEFILDLAKDRNTYVISNDKFSDYFDKLAVIEKRILHYEMFNNYLKIYDLDIDIQF